MHRDLVEQRGWPTQDDYEEGRAPAQLAPGPLAGQLAIYLGYCHYGPLGATLVGVAFVLPRFLLVVAFSMVYVALGGAPLVGAVFCTVGACIIGLITRSAEKLTRKTVGRDRLLAVIWAVLALTTVVTEQESSTLIVLPGLITYLIKAPPPRLRGWGHRGGAWALLPLGWHASATHPLTLALAPLASSQKLVDIAWIFGKAGAFVFGSGLAIVPFLFGGVANTTSG